MTTNGRDNSQLPDGVTIEDLLMRIATIKKMVDKDQSWLKPNRADRRRMARAKKEA